MPRPVFYLIPLLQRHPGAVCTFLDSQYFQRADHRRAPTGLFLYNATIYSLLRIQAVVDKLTNETPRSLQIHPPWRGYCSCAVAIIAIVLACFCLGFGYMEGVDSDIYRWFRSFSFPAIEARYKPLADQLATVTSDTLIDETHSIGNTVLMTNNDYTSVVAGQFTKVYETNRSFDSVAHDYANFLSALPGWTVSANWEVSSRDFADVSNNTQTAKVILEMSDKSKYPAAWEKYQLVYEVLFVYGDPTLWGG